MTLQELAADVQHDIAEHGPDALVFVENGDGVYRPPSIEAVAARVAGDVLRATRKPHAYDNTRTILEIA